MTDFIFRYQCTECEKYLSIPMRNIALDSETKTVYEQFHDILKRTDKYCTFCDNGLAFTNIQFPVKPLDSGELFVKMSNV